MRRGFIVCSTNSHEIRFTIEAEQLIHAKTRLARGDFHHMRSYQLNIYIAPGKQ